MLLKLRYKQPDGDVSTRLDFPIADEGGTLDGASPDFRFAAGVAAFGMVLRDSPYKGDADLDLVAELARSGMSDAARAERWLEDFAEYTMIARTDLARANLEAFLQSGVDDATLVELIASGQVGDERLGRAIERAKAIEDLRAPAQELAGRLAAGLAERAVGEAEAVRANVRGKDYRAEFIELVESVRTMGGR
jgi:hypothetical protein